MKPKTVKVRIHVGVDPKGRWRAYGYSKDDGSCASAEETDHIYDGLDLNDAAYVVTAELPIPEPVEVEGEEEQ